MRTFMLCLVRVSISLVSCFHCSQNDIIYLCRLVQKHLGLHSDTVIASSLIQNDSTPDFEPYSSRYNCIGWTVL